MNTFRYKKITIKNQRKSLFYNYMFFLLIKNFFEIISTLNSLILDSFKPLTLFQLAYNFANIVSFEIEACGRLIYGNQMENRRSVFQIPLVLLSVPF